MKNILFVVALLFTLCAVSRASSLVEILDGCDIDNIVWGS